MKKKKIKAIHMKLERRKSVKKNQSRKVIGATDDSLLEQYGLTNNSRSAVYNR